MNRETPPSIEEEVAVAWFPLGMLPSPMVEEEKLRRAPSAARLIEEALRDAESVGLAIAEIEDMAGGALAE
jgi:hypothetical protein